MNEPTSGFQQCVLGQMDPTLFAPTAALPDGYHELARTSTSRAMDYARSPIRTAKLVGATSPKWVTVSGTESGEAQVGMAWAGVKLCEFGASYAKGKGTHDVAGSQGHAAGTDWHLSNFIWQDGCALAVLPNGKYSACLGMVLNKT